MTAVLAAVPFLPTVAVAVLAVLYLKWPELPRAKHQRTLSALPSGAAPAGAYRGRTFHHHKGQTVTTLDNFHDVDRFLDDLRADDNAAGRAEEDRVYRGCLPSGTVRNRRQRGVR